MSIISRNHIEFMKQFIDDTNTLSKVIKRSAKQVWYFNGTIQCSKIAKPSSRIINY